MRLPRFFARLVLVGSVVIGASIARAQVIYNNMGNGNTFPVMAAFALFGGEGSEAAVQFTAGQSLFLDYVDLRLWHGVGTTVNVALLANTLGDTPGPILESTSASFQAFFTNPLPVTHVEFSNSTFLTAGSKYWLAVSPDVGTVTAWDFAFLPQGLVATDLGQRGFTDPWGTPFAHEEGAMRIIGISATTPVPEASTYGMMAGALLVGIVGLRRRSKT